MLLVRICLHVVSVDFRFLFGAGSARRGGRGGRGGRGLSGEW